MATSEPPPKLFVCELCGLSSPFSYYGQKPPNTRAIVLLEECFVTKDPFSPDKEKFLILGSTCSVCSKCVCAGADCSLFYTKRFCVQCVNKHLDQFPHQIRAELAKKSCSCPCLTLRARSGRSLRADQ
uniref:Cysteine-rich DPF motif domain-containing protein 1 n=1 Tax=Periophthalmus magnuspinnatus TaxID=409849 RepID=A0A3B4BMG2_9GOBI